MKIRSMTTVEDLLHWRWTTNRELVLAYVDSPEQLSVMLLTVAELWLALDTVVSENHAVTPRLPHPELPEGLF